MIEQVLRESQEKMDKAVTAAKEDFSSVRTGRANPAMFHKLTVEYYGTPTPIRDLASFQTPEARMLIVTPYDKSAMPGIEKALRESDLGVNPTNDGHVIRVTFPALTEERRKEYTKLVRAKAEEARVSIRNIRRHAKESLDKLQKDGEVGEDEARRAEKTLDDYTTKHTSQIDEHLKHKEAELLEV